MLLWNHNKRFGRSDKGFFKILYTMLSTYTNVFQWMYANSKKWILSSKIVQKYFKLMWKLNISFHIFILFCTITFYDTCCWDLSIEYTLMQMYEHYKPQLRILFEARKKKPAFFPELYNYDILNCIYLYYKYVKQYIVYTQTNLILN